MQKKILSLFMIILFFAANPTVFSEEPPEPPPQNDFQHNQFPHKSPPRNMIMNYNGRKMPRRYCEFSIIGVKVEEEKKSLAILVYFNDALDTTSILERNILIDNRPLPPFTEFLFSKNRRMMRVPVDKRFFTQDQFFSLKIRGVRSFDGRFMENTEIQNLEPDCFLRRHLQGEKWLREKF